MRLQLHTDPDAAAAQVASFIRQLGVALPVPEEAWSASMCLWVPQGLVSSICSHPLGR